MDYKEKAFTNKSELYEDCRLTICELPGVLNARFSFDERGEVSEIHILSDLSRSPKQVLRDVQSTMFAKYNLALDRRIVSIAQVQTGIKKTAPRQARLVCDRVDLSVSKDNCTATVVLVNDQSEFAGTATAGNTAYGKRRIVAEATLSAVMKFLHDDSAFSLVDIKSVTSNDMNIELAVVSSNAHGKCEMLVGAAVDLQDTSFSVAKATLDAVNRRMQNYL